MQIDANVYQNIDYLLSFEAKRVLVKALTKYQSEESRFWVHPLSSEFDRCLALTALGLLTFREGVDAVGTFWFTQLGYGYTLGIMPKTQQVSSDVKLNDTSQQAAPVGAESEE